MHKVLFTGCTLTQDEIFNLEKENIRIIPAEKNLSEKDLILSLKDCEAVIVNGEEFYSEEVLRMCPNLKIIQYYGIGYAKCIDIETASKYKKIVLNTPKVNSYSVAEFTLGLILALNQKVIQNNENTHKGKWEEKPFFDLKNKTIGILGMGHIGTYFAAIMYNAFHAKILFYDLLEKEEEQAKYHAEKVSLERVFKDSDIVSIHLPLNAETKSLVGQQELSFMKPNALLINTARAEIVDAEALYESLSNDKIAGCAFDGFYTEPIDMNSAEAKLLHLPTEKFILTPHTGYNAVEGDERVKKMCIANLKEMFATETSKNIVNK